jgi:hypothetical protein
MVKTEKLLQKRRSTSVLDQRGLQWMATLLLILIGTIIITCPRTSVTGTAIDEKEATVLQLLHVGVAHSKLTPTLRGEQIFRDRPYYLTDRWASSFRAICSYQLNGCLFGGTSSFDDPAALVILKRCRCLFPFHFFW